ncbi:hypothetical protein J1614_005931 [Plenodomus biglobosus]|nr:hypothetical protein J1614_005931 [Plenodomus biglobosus]
MADRRGVRASSRRKTPTTQPSTNAPTTQPARAPRGRALRSASRDMNEPVHVHVQKATRKRSRQPSVATVTDDSEQEAKAARTTRQKPAKQALGDLTTVEELDATHTDIVELDDIPATPTQIQPEIPMPFRSPGGVSEMSGTTAISSFSMVEAEFLEPKYILKHMRKLAESAEEFLDHLAPYGASMDEDLRNISELQKPESDFTEEYRDFDAELNVHLRHYKNEDHAYIHIRALHRALLGPHRDVVATQSGLDLILYLANLLVFVKETISSDRNSKATWDVLRQLDNSFPSQFMRSLIAGATPTAAGESGLFKETFELALELRTQLAIMVLARQGPGEDTNEIIDEVFTRSDLSRPADGFDLRGWNIPALGGDDASLPQELEAHVLSRCDEIRQMLAMDDKSPDEIITSLGAAFPWESTILRLLHWVRLRHRELTTAIEDLGGAAAVVRNVKQALEELEPAVERTETAQTAPDVPRKKRKSFGRDRRRSGRKFDPNAPLDLHVLDALKAKERMLGAQIDVEIMAQNEQDDIIEPTVKDGDQDDLPLMRPEQDKRQPVPEEMQIEETEDRVVDPFDDSNENVTLVAESQQEAPKEHKPAPEQIDEVEDEVEDVVEDEVEDEVEEEPATNGPPQNSADLLRALQKASQPQKENRPVRSLFERQENAQRVDFGDGFDDSQPTPGPSNANKGKQPAQPSPRKRSRPVDLDDDSDEDVFESHTRNSRVQEQRRKAPAAKRVRIDPSSSSGAPPSHQPPPHPTHHTDYLPPQRRTQTHDEVVSDEDAMDVANVPPSSYEAQRRLAQQNRLFHASQRERKTRQAWSPREEEAFIKYMALFPSQYSQMLTYDKAEGRQVLQDRTQVNLKDKARTMAINMIKSGTGLRPGFEDVVKPSNKDGRNLMAQGFSW